MGGEGQDDAKEMVSSLKTQYASSFEERRAALMAKMGGGNTQKLAKVHRLETQYRIAWLAY